MAIFFSEGEIKKRPGVYQRHTNIGFSKVVSSTDGFCAIPVKAKWGPLNKVLTNVSEADLWSNYGSGEYGDGYTVPAAAAMFAGGASTVYTYRMGSGGKQASKILVAGSEDKDDLLVSAKYPGTMPIKVAVQSKLGDNSRKQFLVYVDTTQTEVWEFAADGKTEGENLIAAVADSKYVNITGTAAAVPTLAVASGALEGGEDPTVTNESYSAAFTALEPYYYNTIALDVDDDENMTLSELLKEYLDSAYQLGKLGIAVVGTTVTDHDFDDRLELCKAFNDAKVVFLGSGYKVGSATREGALAICYTAGVIAATPSNQGIVHAVIDGATDLCESLSFRQYEEAIASGMLMISRSTDGEIWYDSGVNTLTAPEVGTQDDGWKKIRRTKTRFEMIDRIDRALTPKVGRISAGTDGIADVVQTGQRVLNAMVTEGKLMAGATFAEDPANPASGDSAWFIIQADDLDSLEMIYLQYQFRYSQNS